MCFFRSLDYPSPISISLRSRSRSFTYNTRALVCTLYSIKLMDRVFKNACAQRSAYYGIISARKTAVSRVRIHEHRHYLLRYVKYSINHFHGLREKKTFRRAPLYIHIAVYIILYIYIRTSWLSRLGLIEKLGFCRSGATAVYIALYS